MFVLLWPRVLLPGYIMIKVKWLVYTFKIMISKTSISYSRFLFASYSLVPYFPPMMLAFVVSIFESGLYFLDTNLTSYSTSSEA